MNRRGPPSEEHDATKRPFLSKVIVMHTRLIADDSVSGVMPSGPLLQYASVIHESSWTLLRPLVAMFLFCGGFVAFTLVAFHGAPLYGGSDVGVPLAIGVAARVTPGKRSATASATTASSEPHA